MGPDHVEERAENLSPRGLQSDLMKNLTCKAKMGGFDGSEGFRWGKIRVLNQVKEDLQGFKGIS